MVDGEPHSRSHRQWTPLAHALTATGDQWTLMIALQLAPGTVRLAQLRKHLPGISTGVLDRYLQQMVADGLIARRRFREMPPRVEFELTESGRALLPIASSLARWGMRHMWSEPRAGERVDLGALLRLLPTLMGDTPLPGGIVELTVERTERPLRQLFDIREGRLEPIEDAPPKTPWARIEGAETAWIEALGPKRDHRKLRFAGDEQLAQRILAALPARE
ncbi:MAG TPA: helix-turn-helix domain-containing protein [Solirubrobacteraceae bacterium]